MDPTANARVRPYMDERSDDPHRLSAAACEKLASATLDQAAKATYLGLAHRDVTKNSELPSVFVLCVTVRGIGSWCSQCASDTAAVCPPYGYGRLGRNSGLGPDTFRRGLFSLEKSQSRKKAACESLCLPLANWNCPLFLNGRADKGVPAALHPPVRQPDDCRPRTRHVWGTRQSRWLRTADGFAVSELLYSAAAFKTSAPSLRK
jgi:hypothetical protein